MAKCFILLRARSPKRIRQAQIPLVQQVARQVARHSAWQSRRSPNQAKTKPCGVKGWKSAALMVASFAPQRIATAAIMQSASERERRQVWLNKRAAKTASGSVKISSAGNIERASASPVGSSGPQRYSAQATELMPKDSLAADHC